MVIAFILWGLFFYTQLRAEEVSNAELLEAIKELKEEVAELKGDEPKRTYTKEEIQKIKVANEKYLKEASKMFEKMQFCMRNKEKNHMHEWYKKKCS